MATAKVYGGISVSIRGLEEVQAMLAKVGDPKEANKVLQRATDAGGKVLKPFLVAGAPYPDMKAAVWIHRASRQRPATVAGHHVKKAFYWHMVVGGTKDHGPRRAPWIVFRSKSGAQVVTSRVRGVKPNPFVARAAASGQAAAMAAVEKVVDDYLNSL